MRLGVLSDLHVGYTGESRWHNRKMWSEAPTVASAAVAHLNGLSVDRALILGDITESGEVAELEQAFECLKGLHSQWYVLPGNHDRTALAAGTFDQVFAGHIPPVYEVVQDVGMLHLREAWPREERNEARMDWSVLEAVLPTILNAPPALLTIFAHFPLIPERTHAAAHNGLYAGHWVDGERLLAHLKPALPGRIAIFCGHQHWHHHLLVDGMLQCTNASLIEYPMETRLVTLTPGRVQIEVQATASADIATASLETATWVRGEARDRVGNFAVPFVARD